jgi:hypothetical protein
MGGFDALVRAFPTHAPRTLAMVSRIVAAGKRILDNFFWFPSRQMPNHERAAKQRSNFAKC